MVLHLRAFATRMNGINHARLVFIYHHVLAMVWCERGGKKLLDSFVLQRYVLPNYNTWANGKTKANISLLSKTHHLKCDIILRSHYANKDIAAPIA
jgi:hypothetical protein